MSTMIRPALSLLVLMTLITGVAYPLVVTGVAQVAFPAQANGSLVRDADGKVRGSSLIAQDFTGDGWFHPRPSAGAWLIRMASPSPVPRWVSIITICCWAKRGPKIMRSNGSKPPPTRTVGGPSAASRPT